MTSSPESQATCVVSLAFSLATSSCGGDGSVEFDDGSSDSCRSIAARLCWPVDSSWRSGDGGRPGCGQSPILPLEHDSVPERRASVSATSRAARGALIVFFSYEVKFKVL